jgi:hypothetical protein
MAVETPSRLFFLALFLDFIAQVQKIRIVAEWIEVRFGIDQTSIARSNGQRLREIAQCMLFFTGQAEIAG